MSQTLCSDVANRLGSSSLRGSEGDRANICLTHTLIVANLEIMEKVEW